MKKLFTEYWQEFDLRYIKNMYGVELPLFYFVIYWSWSLVFGNAAGTDATSVTEKIILAAAVIFPTVFSGLHSRHGSGSIYGAGRTVLVSAYFME